jgi:flagellar motor switch protein FliM
LRELVDLQAGDIIPIDMPETIRFTANTIPLFETKLGQCGDSLALRVERPVKNINRDIGDMKSRLLGMRTKNREEKALEAMSEAMKEAQESKDE